jgi:hypothetical protein
VTRTPLSEGRAGGFTLKDVDTVLEVTRSESNRNDPLVKLETYSFLPYVMIW